MLCIAAALVPFVSALPAITSASALPTYFQIKSQVVPGQRNKGVFNNLLLGYKEQLTGNELYPAFVQLNAASIIMELQESIPASGSQPALSYLSWNMSDGSSFRAGLLFEELPYAAFEPTAFFRASKPAKDYLATAQEQIVQNRFYLNQSSTGTFLEWANNKTEPASNQWSLWLRESSSTPHRASNVRLIEHLHTQCARASTPSYLSSLYQETRVETSLSPVPM